MLMYHPNSAQPVDVHETQIENMKQNGWTTKPKSTKPPKEAKENGS